LTTNESAVRSEAEHTVWLSRTPLGAAWRGGAVLTFTVAAIAASAWAGSKLIDYDYRLLTGPTGPVAVLVGGLVAGWLRGRNPGIRGHVRPSSEAGHGRAPKQFDSRGR
jgi:hypothetical protein